MLDGHNTDTLQDWHRCKEVRLKGGIIGWEVSPTDTYKLTEAYRQAPHRQFIGAKNAEAIQAFVKTWGPLWRDASGSSTGRCSVDLLAKERDTLVAWLKLFADIERGTGVPEAICSLLKLENRSFVIGLKFWPAIPPDEDEGTAELEGRIMSAPTAKIASICDFLVGLFPKPKLGRSLVIERTRNGSGVRATNEFLNLLDALYWMVGEDIFHKKPFWFCRKCGRFIRANGGQRRLFCDPPVSGNGCGKQYHGTASKKKMRSDPKRREKEQERRRIREGRKARTLPVTSSASSR